MNRATIDEVNALAYAAYNLNFHQFCEMLGWSEDDYTMDKFQQFQQLGRLLGRFDNETLSKLAARGRQFA